MDQADHKFMSLFRPNSWNRLKTWPASWWRRQEFAQLKMFVLFVGYPRTGHSLVGSLLNAHRHGIIAHELNVMHYVRRRFTREQICWILQQKDKAFEELGRRWTDYDYRVPGQWQGRCESLQFIGDKHANGASKLIGQQPGLIDVLQDRMQVPVRLVHIVRHPLDTISTMARRNIYGKSLTECAEEYLRLCDTNEYLCTTHADSLLTLHLEDLIARPLLAFSRLTRFLGLETDQEYLNACCSIVRGRESRTRNLVEWPHWVLMELARRRDAYAFLQPYGDLSQPANIGLARTA